MTVELSRIQGKIQEVELSADRIEVKLSNGGALVDDDAAAEVQRRSLTLVDFFVNAFPNQDGLVQLRPEADASRLERFRASASLWGSVSEKLASISDVREVQEMFDFGRGVAQRVLREFQASLDAGKASLFRRGNLNFVQISYVSPRGEPMQCSVSFEPGQAPRVTSFFIDDTIGGPDSQRIRVLVRDPAVLARFSEKLQAFLPRR